MNKQQLKDFVAEIENFNNIKHPSKILLFGYYLQNIKYFELFTIKNIGECYDLLDINRPTNLPDSLKKLKDGKKLIQKNLGFRIVKCEAEKLQKSFEDNSIDSKKLEKVYSPGESYDFYNDLKKIIESATSNVFLINAYATEDIINLYLDKLDKGIQITILTNCKYQENFVSIATKFKSKHGKNFRVKTNKNCHDRILFVDKKCYVTGQSLDKEALKQPTYLCEIENSGLFRKIFEELLNSGKTLI